MRPLHPKVIKGLLNFMLNPQQEIGPVSFNGRYFAFYSDVACAIEENPGLLVYQGWPYDVFKNRSVPALFDFSPLGALIVSLQPLDHSGPEGVHQHTLAPIVDYIFSDDLWGQSGKWTRFHERLNEIFKKYDLLSGDSFPGRYELKSVFQKLEKRGIMGEFSDDHYVLTLPWTFSLSALVKLEQVIIEEF
jgi:hypothetical protein